ncbi:uncharacterized protein LOC143892807 isoform X1 [Tasmannia lanceolata]|uniref:uncharacterized protein LOC143892807 isoform X1 n=1 Tax=Tasmannia lanceolata TaxID=3420 RepID=UPI0040643328
MTITDICWLDQWPDNVHRSAAPCGPICGPEPLHFGPYASCPYSYFGNGQFEIGYFSFIFLLQILPFELRGHSNSNIPSSIPILQDLEIRQSMLLICLCEGFVWCLPWSILQVVIYASVGPVALYHIHISFNIITIKVSVDVFRGIANEDVAKVVILNEHLLV